MTLSLTLFSILGGALLLIIAVFAVALGHYRVGARDLSNSIQALEKRFFEVQQHMTETVFSQFSHMHGRVEQRLSDGLDKTTATFTDIVKRLTLIDQAQKQLAELSSNVVSLQEIFIDKRSRGIFGETQLKNLVQNVLPQAHFSLQHTLSNGTRVDCLLFLPPPTGNIAVDSKFPLENFQKMTDFHLAESERKKSQVAFKQDMKRHIQDIATKYILPNETADGAILFIPAEAIFTEIHAHCPELVEIAHRAHVWMASPTTLMAILTTARSVLKDTATREHIHVIQSHLRNLADDFQKFETHVNHLTKDIDRVQRDIHAVQTSAQKITQRFIQIEKAEPPPLEMASEG